MLDTIKCGRPPRFCLLMLLIFCGAATVKAQDTIPNRARPGVPSGMQGIPIDQAEILRRLRDSGMSPDQIRAQLRQRGFDPAIADRYLDALAQRDSTGEPVSFGQLTRQLPLPTSNLLGALRSIGILSAADTVLARTISREDSTRNRRRIQPRDSIVVFGRDLFSATTLQFQPMLSGPVDPDYRLGPGDMLTLVVTGDVERLYELDVSDEGIIFIPDVGQVTVNGLTLAEARRRLNDRLARVYSGVRTGSAQFDLGVGRQRRNLVYLVGAVEIPGPVLVSGGATVFNALYQGGGPTLNGSFRKIEVRRESRLIREVDLYDYLTRGDKGNDIRLEQNDVVFIPIVGKQVRIEGSIRQPAIYELKPGEGLADVLHFAGGVGADAALERIQIDRIRPPGQRTPGNDRVLMDVTDDELRTTANTPLEDGDRIRVFTVSDERRFRTIITGDVYRPAQYQWRPGMTVLDLVNEAQGLLPSAYTPAAHVIRLNPTDSTNQLIQVSLGDPSALNHASRIALQDLDSIIVFGRARLANPQTVEIFGEVKETGPFSFSRGMTVRDLVLIAGGVKEGAVLHEAEVSRRVLNGVPSDTLASVQRVRIDLQLSGSPGGGDANFALEPGDQVFIRRLPGFQVLKTLEIFGAVLSPGHYTVEYKDERLSRIIARAGGLSTDAYAQGARLFREGKPLGINLPRALARPGGTEDLAIEPGDRLEVPRYDPSVLVTGEVAFETRVIYVRGLSLRDYVRRAGGANDDGNVDRASVRYPNGELRTASSFLGVDRDPEVQPGSIITVPRRPESQRFNWDSFLSRTLSVLTTLATVIVAANSLK